MRVLHVTPVYEPGYAHGGLARSVPALCRALASAGADVTVLTTNANMVEDLDVPTGWPTNRDGVTVFYLRRQFPRRMYRSPDLRRLARTMTSRADLVHITGLWAYPGAVAAAHCAQAGVPYIVSPRGMLLPWAMHHRGLKKSVYFNFFERRRLYRADAIHCTDDEEKSALVSHGLEGRSFVVPNGVDLTEYSSLPERGFLRGELGIPPRARLILFMGRLNVKKGIELTLDGFARLAREMPDAQLVLAGSEEQGYAGRVRLWAERAGLADRVHLPGLLSGRARLAAFADADLFVLLSKSENFGLAVAEAMASSLPVVVTRGVPLHGPIEGARAGKVVGEDPEEVTRAMESMLDVEAGRSAGRRGRQLVAERFSIEAVGRRMLAEYERVLSASRRDHGRVQQETSAQC